MNKYFSLITDCVLIFLTITFFTFCVFRFYLPSLWLSAAIALAVGGAASCLFFLRRHKKLEKKFVSERERHSVENLAFHLALQSPSDCAALILKCLNRSKNETTYTQNQDNFILSDNELYYVCFRLDKVTADNLRPVLRNPTEHKAVFAADYTPEARNLSDAFNIHLLDAADTYRMFKDTDCLPEHLDLPPHKKDGFRQKIAFRIRRQSWKGYAFSGISLLLLSLFTVFPVYYIVSGGILLITAIAIRVFGTDKQ